MANKPSKPRRRRQTPAQQVEYQLEWKPVPAKPRDLRKTRITQIVEQLQQNPGKSARVARNAKSTSSTAPWRKYGCVAHIRQAEDDPNLFDVYAWWPVPGENPDAEETDT